MTWSYIKSFNNLSYVNLLQSSIMGNKKSSALSLSIYQAVIVIIFQSLFHPPPPSRWLHLPPFPLYLSLFQSFLLVSSSLNPWFLTTSLRHDSFIVTLRGTKSVNDVLTCFHLNVKFPLNNMANWWEIEKMQNFNWMSWKIAFRTYGNSSLCPSGHQPF